MRALFALELEAAHIVSRCSNRESEADRKPRHKLDVVTLGSGRIKGIERTPISAMRATIVFSERC